MTRRSFRFVITCKRFFTFFNHFFLTGFADCFRALAVGAPFVPGLRIFSPEPALIRAFFAAIFA
jgi:hypothetical protein